MTDQKRDILHSLWDFFCSLKLTMVLLIVLALISIIGTVIPQGTPPPEYIAAIGQTRLGLYKALGFLDMYHSWWFILLLYLLTVNLVACSVKRLPHIWSTIRHPVTQLSDGVEKTAGCRAVIPTGRTPEAMRDHAATVLASLYGEPTVSDVDGATHLFAQKTPWCRLSVYVVHLSIIVIFIGAMIGSLFGFKSYANIVEGASISKVQLRSGKELDLGFAVRCDRFSAAFYPGGAPKEFKSILTVLENGRPVPGLDHRAIIVNDPLTYKGITFYQSSYGNAGSYFFSTTDLDGGNARELTFGSDESAQLPDGSSMHVLETTPDIAPYSPGLSGPAANVEIHSAGGATERVVVYANHPELNIEHARHHGAGPVLHYRGEEKRMYTGLQVAKDPGVEIVWLGCILMVAGVYTAFFLSHRRIWVRIGDGEIRVAGHASKNQGGFQRSFDLLVERLKDSADEQ